MLKKKHPKEEGEQSIDTANESVAELESKLSEMETKYLRALADYQNLLRASLKDKEDFAKYAQEQFLLEILPVYDNLKLSLEHADSEDKNAWLEGVRFVTKQFKSALENLGVSEIEAIGQAYDHSTMEASETIETQEADKDGHVAKILKSGYKLKDKLIMPARVAVYKINDK